MDYLTGHVKRNTATGEVAVRTRYQPTNDKLAAMTWLISSPDTGPKFTSESTVAEWADLFTPEAGS